MSWLSLLFFFSSRGRHTRCYRDWSSDVCSSDLPGGGEKRQRAPVGRRRPGRAALVEQKHAVILQRPVQPAFPPGRSQRAEPRAALQEEQPRQVRGPVVGSDDLAREQLDLLAAGLGVI